MSRYGADVWIEDVVDSNGGRFLHGCTSYINNDNIRVNMVCGGSILYSDNIGHSTDTCVINLEGTNDWTLTHPLPAYNYYLRMITVDNRVFMIGNISCFK